MAEPQRKVPTPVTPALKTQCVQEALDCRNAAAVARGRGPGSREAENRHLKELLGDKDLEIAILKDLVKKADRVPPRGVK